MNAAARESAILGTLLECNGAVLPPNLSRLLEHAPESFDDGRHGAIAIAIRALKISDKPVHALAVAEIVKFEGAALFISHLANTALPIELAELEAEPLWAAYRARRIQTLFGEAQEALKQNPDHVESVSRHVCYSLEKLTADAPWSRPKLTLRTPDEILNLKFDDSDRILGDRLIAKGQNFTLCGASSVGKSRLALQMAVSSMTGRQFVSFETRGVNLKWLFIQAENSNRRLQFDLGKLRAWIGEHAWPVVNELLIIHTLETDIDGFLNLDDEANRAAILELIQSTKPDVIVFDSLYNFQIGDLNKDTDMAATLRTISFLTKTGNPERVPLVLHHAITGKAGAAKATGYDRASFGRNSKVLHAWTRGQINVAAGSPDNNETLILSCGKCSNGREFEPFAVRLNPETFIYEPDPTFDMSAWESDMTGKPSEPLMNPDRVRELCAVSGMSKAELAKAITDDCGCYRGSAYRYVARAEKAKKIALSKTNEKYFRK